MEIDFCNKKCYLESKNVSMDMNSKENIRLLEELKRRVEITYRTRINSTNRLRDKHNEYKKLNIYYSALVTGISILSIGIDIKIAKISVSNIVLMFSIVLTYFMFYISEQNLQERAYRMEDTFKSLDKLRNKISIMMEYNKLDITEEKCKKLYKEYEAILASIENHDEIDYDMYILATLKKEGIGEDKKKSYLEVENRVKSFLFWRKVKITLKYLIPTTTMASVIVAAIVL